MGVGITSWGMRLRALEERAPARETPPGRPIRCRSILLCLGRGRSGACRFCGTCSRTRGGLASRNKAIYRRSWPHLDVVLGLLRQGHTARVGHLRVCMIRAASSADVVRIPSHAVQGTAPELPCAVHPGVVSPLPTPLLRNSRVGEWANRSRPVASQGRARCMSHTAAAPGLCFRDRFSSVAWELELELGELQLGAEVELPGRRK